MRYDFDRVLSRRNTNCEKWDDVESLFGEQDVLPMWVADMDMPVAQPITDALRKRIEHPIYGYALSRPPSVAEAVQLRMRQKYGWQVEPEWIVFTPGIVPALYAAVKAYTHPGDEVILQGPVYYRFWTAITDNGCQVANNRLQLVRGRYEIDFDDLEAKFAPKADLRASPSRVRMMLLCNPHNPVGRVWTREELLRIGEIVIRHGAIILSDEVFGELLFHQARHIPFASLSDEFAQHSIVCISPSKAFNLSGLGASAIIIPNARLRQRFLEAKQGIMPWVNVLGLVAFEAAFREGDEWLEQFLAYLHGNLAFALEYFAQNIPRIKVIPPEGTYLLWLDCRELGLDPMHLRTFLRKEAKVALDDGYLFGPSGAGFQRMNIACPRSILVEALQRIEKAVNSL
ncbi:MAG: putative C-S lyase [Nitrospinota bacterium]|nr:MAG: putative C-S lyase [Nitrospinota bacterium]